MRIVQIGVGGWGKNHARILSEMGALAAVCDPAGAQYASKYSVSHYDTPAEALKSEKFDGAIIATPTATHAEIATMMLEAKKHVLVEKPMTYSSADGARLAETARRNKVILTCGYLERFNPALGIIKDYIRNKTYGDLVMMEFHRENRMPLHIKDVGIIYDTSVHDIETANWLFGSTPQMVFASSGRIRHEHEDHATIMLGYQDSRVAVSSSNWITPNRVRRLSVVLTEAIISTDFITQKTTIEKDGESETPDNEWREPLLLEIQGFIDAINGKKSDIVSPQEAVNVTKIAEAALLSGQKGIPVYLDLK
ncbi:MAG: gfo/Idh/MocA family oxidoreductase [Nitrosopumilus sp. H13]|nr:MAG: gfo/Idh/MocA family oxidoreductase [Nitrosopumilus sp. H13]